MTTEDLLLYAQRLTAAGLSNPLLILAELGRKTCGVSHFALPPAKHECAFAASHRKAYLATMNAAGGSLVKWYGLNGRGRDAKDASELFAEALFDVQLGG